jgi:P27 family predicted phage terminase small subunit
MRGPKPQPTAIKVLKGNPGKRALNKDEPTPAVLEDLSPPADMREAARVHWNRLAPMLRSARLLTEADRDALALLCNSQATYDEAHEQISRFGLVVKAPSGFPVQSPYLAIRNKAQEQVLKLLCEFGITPSARSRVTATPQAHDSAWAKLKAGAHAHPQSPPERTTH